MSKDINKLRMEGDGLEWELEWAWREAIEELIEERAGLDKPKAKAWKDKRIEVLANIVELRAEEKKLKKKEK
ncbi:MAG: hypothetical protein DRN81_03020 [Thermoproteota archaeon]|nr:MAG: hypothetical protein DRN81_03020 [Candidatus Korarchaeota archaeon]